MASIDKRQQTAGGKVSWRARYRDPQGRERSKSFQRKVDAQRFLTTVESAKLASAYVDPARSAVVVGILIDEWLAGKLNLKPSTRARYESAINVHIRPRWGSTPLSKVTHADVQTWLASMVASGLSAASVREAHGVLNRVLARAVRNKRISANPAEDVDLPRIVERKRRYLTAAEVTKLAEASGQHRLAVLVLAYCGLRWSELAALRAGRVDLVRGRLRVAEAMVEVNGGRIEWGTPKSHESRSVPLRDSSSTNSRCTWPASRRTRSCSSRQPADRSVTEMRAATGSMLRPRERVRSDSHRTSCGTRPRRSR